MALTRQEAGDLRRFLCTGRLGPLKPGMTSSEVQRLLGSPDSSYVVFDGELKSEIYFYGEWLESTLNNEVLTRLSLRYKWQTLAGVRRRVLRLAQMDAPWASAVGRWNFLRFKHFLRQAGQGFWLRRFSDDSLQIRLRSGGSIVFSHPGSYGLYSIDFSLEPHPGQRGGWQANRSISLPSLR